MAFAIRNAPKLSYRALARFGSTLRSSDICFALRSIVSNSASALPPGIVSPKSPKVRLLSEKLSRFCVSASPLLQRDNALLTATAAVATMGDAKSFRSGREFAAWLGLVPGQTGRREGSIVRHKQTGDTYLRTLLIHGSRSVLFHSKQPSQWIEQLKKRRPLNIVMVALANKMARMIWAILAHDKPYRKDHATVKPVEYHLR